MFFNFLLCIQKFTHFFNFRKFQNKHYSELKNEYGSDSSESEDRFDIRMHKLHRQT